LSGAGMTSRLSALLCAISRLFRPRKAASVRHPSVAIVPATPRPARRRSMLDVNELARIALAGRC
jgi:hypothetical protein